MATIRRHRVPADSYDPSRPLNDLGRDQLKHFIHVAERLPPELRVDLPIPSPEDGLACSRFIGAVTEKLMSRKQPRLKVVSRQGRKSARKSAAPAQPGRVERIAATEGPAEPSSSAAEAKPAKTRKPRKQP